MARETFSLEDLGKNFGSQPNKNSSYSKNKNNSNSKKNTPIQSFKPQKNNPPPVNIKIATAPYNFISLPEKVLPSEIENVDAFKNHIKERGKISGEIVLEIETYSPLFLGGNGEKSFAPAGNDKFIIPGSSLRGMFKNIFKILTCGAFRGSTNSQKKGEDFNDEHIYFRCLMATNNSPQWMEDLCNTYKARMEGANGKNARPGFLIQTDDNKYFIAPLKFGVETKNDFIMIKDFQERFGAVKFKDSRVKWYGEIAYILTGNQWADTSRNPDNHKHLLTRKQYEEFKASLKGLTEDERAQKIKDTNHGKQIIRFFTLEDIDWSKRIELPDDVLTSYEHDRNRHGVNLINYKKINSQDKNEGILEKDRLKKLCDNLPPDVETLIPCHFLYEGDKVTAFGHGQCFRIPYKNSIGKAVPENLQDEKIIDFADAIFGRKENWASRVAFEDAAPISKIATLKTAAAHPLMQPNPTSYQLYLTQDEEFLKHWDKEQPQLRGYKLYWHNQTWNWKATQEEINLDAGKDKDKRLTKDLTPLQRGNKFKSKIRFQNLSAVELGALLMIFDLNGAKNPAYKIGMGKPFGFGSIKINHALFIESDDAYTGEIFDLNGFKSPYKASDTQEYIKVFKDYVNAKIGLTAWQNIMTQLNKILDWDNKPASKNILPMGNVQNNRRQMDLDDRLKQRVPLPNIFAVK